MIGEEEVHEEINIKPNTISKLLMESPSIQVQQTSAVNGSVSLRLQGLDGKYTQILKDGFPLYGGIGQGLSVTQIPPLDLKQVEIIKGSASTLYGSDAIAGIINLISKEPQKKRELTLLANQTSLLGTSGNAYYSQRWGRAGISLLASGNFQQLRDVDKDGFSDLPEAQTFNVIPAFHFYFDSSATMRLTLNGMSDNRTGGDMMAIRKQPDETHRYISENRSERVSAQLKFSKTFLKERCLTVKNSLSRFIRSVRQPSSSFKGTQSSTYTEISFRSGIGDHLFVAGADLNTESFAEDSSKSHRKRDFDYMTAGIFLQDDWKPAEKIVLQAGMRADYQDPYGYFMLPRFALICHFTHSFYVRAGSGLGYKAPTLFSSASEQEGITDIQPLSSSLRAEKSLGSNLDFNWKLRAGEEGSITINQSFFITQINNPLVLDSVRFVNKNQPVSAAGSETNIRYRIEAFQIFAAYTFVEARRQYDALQSFVPLTPQHKINLDIIYGDEDDFSAALEGYYISSMFRDADTKTRSFFTVGLILQKHFERFSLIANCENLFDVRQSRFENVVLPPNDNPVFREIYAPLDGRVVNIALRIKL